MPMLPNLNPDDLIVFYVAAKEKSLSSAADKLFLSQPAVTYHIQSLEKYARVKLLEFKRHQIILTPPGKELLKYAEGIYQQLVDAERYIRFIREANLRVGIASVFDSIIGPFLPAMFEMQHPGATLMIKSGNAFEIVQDVINSTLDLAIVPKFDYGSEKISHVQVSNPEKIVCFTAPHQSMPREPLEWKDLVKYPVVSGPETSVFRRLIFDKFREHGLEEPVLAAEVGNVEWCKTLVENGKGLSFTLEKDIINQVNGGRFKLLPLKEYPYVTAESITRIDVANPIITNFVAVVKNAFGYVEKPKPAV
jgi:LysR family transcriptional regulator, transcriptional activator of the cysJI operon